ncbi:uncharacterized protein TRIADDRAFT_57940 [Trichoplax adhaerens]|uniref:Uncharacterized protein n=1 Tax=Trichoplax adhaerens TaxID=10228 RepID=B3S264_TRIAD|nr:predicted protein [Trichoplax adhaerens]EDV23059.1 predicted protein [Trichoplax adhaerens]|eukprot:XP_002113969.1 predicted protein [Trichoplax adhaerens]
MELPLTTDSHDATQSTGGINGDVHFTPTMISQKRKRQDEDDPQQQQQVLATNQPIDYNQLPLCSGRWLALDTPLTVEQLRDQVRKRKSYENNQSMRKRLRITGTKCQLLQELRSYDHAKMDAIKDEIQDWDIHQCLDRLIACLHDEIDEYYVAPLLRRLCKLLQVYHADLYAGQVKEELNVDMIGINLFQEACFRNLDFILSCPQMNKILYQDKLIAPAAIARQVKNHQRQLAVEQNKLTATQAQQLASVDDLAVASDQSMSCYSLFPTAILTRIVRDQSGKYDRDRALKRIIQLSKDTLTRESCGMALSEAVSRICHCYQLKDKLLQYGILECAAINFKDDPMCSQHFAQFMDSLNCSDWRQQSCDTLITVLEYFVIPAIEGYHNHVLDIDFSDQAFCVAHRLFSSLQQPQTLATIMEKISDKHPILSYMKGQLNEDSQNLRGIELGNTIVEHLENWSTLSQDHPIKLKHRWLTYSDSIKKELSSELFIRLSKISSPKRQETDYLCEDKQA